MMEFETRSGLPVEVRTDADGKITVEGYAAVFNQPTNIADMFMEVIAPGAFRSALKRGDDVEFLINHSGLPLARSTAGNLVLKEDERGLHINAELDPTDPDVQLIVPKMRGKMLDQMSFAFRAIGQSWETPAEGLDVRTITDVTLFDVSIVNRGQYPEASIALRSRDQMQQQAESEISERDANRAAWALRQAQRRAEQEQKFRRI